MPKLLVAVILLFITAIAHADQKAITDTGQVVILKGDGTWSFVDDSTIIDKAIHTNKTRFKKPDGSTFLLKSTRNDTAFWIDPNIWGFKKATTNISAEYELQLKGADLYGAIIAEGIQVPIDNLADIALLNAQNIAPDMEVTQKEYRHVNGKKVIYMVMNGTTTMQGIKITYLGYYYSNSSGSTQIVAMTSSNLVSKYKAEINDFLNGLVVK